MARHVLKRPGDMFTFRRVLAFWAAVLALTVVSGAHAQTATLAITKTGVTHTASRSATRPNTYINKADCLADDLITFPLTATGTFSSYSFQVWVGTQDCTVLANRTTFAFCSEVLNSTYAQVSGSTTSASTALQLHVRDLLAAYQRSAGSSGSSGSGGSGGTAGTAATAGGGGADTSTAGTGGAATTTTTVVSGGIDACNQAASTDVVGATTITVYFMFVDPSTANFIGGDNWVGTFKLVGPQPPDIISAGIGGNLLVVNFSYSTAVVTDATRNGFTVYCDPPPGSIAADAGLVDDSGVGSAVVCPASLSSSVLVPGADPPTNGKYKCGSGAITSTTANASNLIDGVPYNVAVSAIDSYENTGPLSTLACQVPQPVTGFYKAYRDAGGQAGGGFCSISNKREPILLLAVLGIASCLLLRRRRSA